MPTGTCTGRAGVETFMPRIRPSVEPRATQRTRLPPRCCCTSPVRLDLDALVFAIDLDGVVDFGQVPFLEFDVERRADDLHDLANFLAVGYGGNHWKAPNS